LERVIRIGNPTDRGGNVLAGDTPCVVFGKAVARIGDTRFCPREGHDNCRIIESNANYLVGSIPVTFKGYHTDCGAMLEATLGTYGAG